MDSLGQQLLAAKKSIVFVGKVQDGFATNRKANSRLRRAAEVPAFGANSP